MQKYQLMLANKTTTYWQKSIIQSLLDRDPVDAINFIETLALAAQDHFTLVTEQANKANFEGNQPIARLA